MPKKNHTAKKKGAEKKDGAAKKDVEGKKDVPSKKDVAVNKDVERKKNVAPQQDPVPQNYAGTERTDTVQATGAVTPESMEKAVAAMDGDPEQSTFGLLTLSVTDRTGILARIEPRGTLVEHVAEMVVAFAPDGENVDALVRIEFTVEDDGTQPGTPGHVRYAQHSVTPVSDPTVARSIWESLSSEPAWRRVPTVIGLNRNWPLRNIPSSELAGGELQVTTRFFDCFGGGVGDPGSHMCSLELDFFVESAPATFPFVTRIG